MKTIIVPTDFSVNASNALTYACEVNKKLKAEIRLLHCYHIPVPVSDGYILPVTDLEIRKIAEDGIRRVKTNYEASYPGMQFTQETTMGMATDEIVAGAEKTNCDLIVMGTHGATGWEEFLIGTNTATVMEDATCPVLAVPENATFNGLKKIVFAADYGNHNFSHMTALIDIARMFNSEIILLHIASGEAEDGVADWEIAQFKERIVSESNYANITYRLLEDEDVYHGLHRYVEEFTPDMIAVSMRNRSLVQKIFSRSLTKRMAYHSHVPVLALHIRE